MKSMGDLRDERLFLQIRLETSYLDMAAVVKLFEADAYHWRNHQNGAKQRTFLATPHRITIKMEIEKKHSTNTTLSSGRVPGI